MPALFSRPLQVYSAVYAPETGPFLLVCTVVPPVMAFVSMLVIRPRDPEPNPNEAADAARFRFLYVRALLHRALLCSPL